MSGRRLEDAEIWERVKKTTKPLHTNHAAHEFRTQMTAMEIAKPIQMKPNPRVVRPYRPEPEILVSLAPKPDLLDQSTTRKISKGKISIDSKIDLHGMTQAEAYSRLYRFTEMAYATGRRTILVITGKGVKGEGILRTMVPRWLSEPSFRLMVSAYNEAHISHGGGGALYVRIRRKSNRS